jgi:hypothetical protein
VRKVPVPHYGDAMSFAAYSDCVKQGIFTDNDGFGHPSDGRTMDAEYFIDPSNLDLDAKLFGPEGPWTRVVWFNK